MSRTRPEPVQVVKQRRDAAMSALVHGVPYINFLGIEFERRGDELTAILPFDDKLIGNPLLPAIHGGVTAGFLETTAVIGLVRFVGRHRKWSHFARKPDGRPFAQASKNHRFHRRLSSVWLAA
jgi:acyl-coenzyme A thioesterase PaaI-like protein